MPASASPHRVIILTADAFEDLEVFYPMFRLQEAGVVNGRRVTSYWHDGVPEDLKQAGAIHVDAPVVVDGNLVTSRWPPDLPDFMREVMAKLEALHP